MNSNMLDYLHSQNYSHTFEHINLYHHRHKVMDIRGTKKHINVLKDLQMYLLNKLFHKLYLLNDHNNL